MRVGQSLGNPAGCAGTAREVRRYRRIDTTIQHRMETTMSELTDKAKGLANQAIGKAKQGIGELTGSEETKADGAAQEAEGHGQKAVGDAKGAVKTTANKAAGAVDDALNR